VWSPTEQQKAEPMDDVNLSLPKITQVEKLRSDEYRVDLLLAVYDHAEEVLRHMKPLPGQTTVLQQKKRHDFDYIICVGVFGVYGSVVLIGSGLFLVRKLIEDWKPKAVFIIGRATGGDRTK